MNRWFGAMWYPLAVWLVRMYSRGDAGPAGRPEVLSLLLGPVVLAAAMELAVRLTPGRPFGRS